MSAFLYGIGLQFKLDIRSKALLITCYLIPLLFFFVMGAIFTSIMPESKDTLIQSMSIFGVSMGALAGFPASVVEVYGSDIKKVYKANGVPLYLGLVNMFLSAFIHLFIMCAIICVIAPIAFDVAIPTNLPLYFCGLAIFIAVSLGIGCFLGLSVKDQAKLTMVAQIFFLPSIMLSGIMFPVNLLPRFLEIAGRIFPASWGYRLLTGDGNYFSNLWPILVIFAVAALLCGYMLKRLRSE